MKLLLCRKCQDIIKLQLEVRTCLCGSSSGRYLSDGLHAQISGDQAECLGLNNGELASAISFANCEAPFQFRDITSFVIGHDSPRVKRVKEIK